MRCRCALPAATRTGEVRRCGACGRAWRAEHVPDYVTSVLGEPLDAGGPEWRPASVEADLEAAVAERYADELGEWRVRVSEDVAGHRVGVWVVNVGAGLGSVVTVTRVALEGTHPEVAAVFVAYVADRVVRPWRLADPPALGELVLFPLVAALERTWRRWRR